METALLMSTTAVGLGALVAICLLLKMIVAGPYRSPLQDGEGVGLSPDSMAAEAKHTSDAPPLPIPRSRSRKRTPILDLDWGVAYFVQDLCEWESKAERDEADDDLAAIQRRRELEPRED